MLDEERERADKALRLNGFNGEDSLYFKSKVKPTIKIKRLNLGGSGIRLKGASSFNSNIQRQLLDRERIKNWLIVNYLVRYSSIVLKSCVRDYDNSCEATTRPFAS